MLETLDEFTRKSWSGYSGPTEKFALYNIFFGENGQGKSAFASEIAYQLGDMPDVNPSSIAYFDKDYIRRVMLLSEAETAIRGVRVDFGEQNVSATKEIEEKRDCLAQIEKNLEEDYASFQAIAENVDREIDSIFRGLKGKSSIQGKRKGNIIEKRDAWIDEYTKAKKRFPQQDFSIVTGDEDLEQKLEALKPIQIPSFLGFSEEEVEELSEMCFRSYTDLNIPSTQIIAWISEGLKVHSDSSQRCLFCGSESINLESIEYRLQEYLNAESAKAEQKMNLAIKRLEEMSHYNEQFKSTSTTLKGIVGDLGLGTLFERVDENCSQLKACAEELSEKTKDMKSPSFFHADELNYCISNMSSLVHEASELLAGEKRQLEEKVDNFNTLIKGAIGFKIQQQLSIEKGCQEYALIGARIEEREKTQVSTKSEIAQLEESKSDISDFATFLNQELEALCFPFRLTCNSEEKTYSIALIEENRELALEDISEGERNLLAFAFFFFSLYQDNRQERVKDDLEAIIIDDPVSSVDERNLFYMLSMLRHLLNSNTQLFLFTHVWTDFALLTAHGINKETTKTWRIRKSDKESQLVECSRGAMPYKELFSQVYRFSQMSETDPEFETVVVHMPNALRRILEEYLDFNSSVRTIASGKTAEIGKVLFAKDWLQIEYEKRRSVEQLVDVTNAFSHRVPKPENSRDVHECAKFFMSRIKEVNPSHFHAMKQ